MKISPVTGTPTIANLPASGISPEKMARLKAIASGDSQIGVSQREEDMMVPVAPKQKTITMKTNQTINRGQMVEQEPQKEEEPAQTTTPDANVQANAAVEATTPLSPQQVALAKQRRALQVKEREIADKMKALETQAQAKADLEARIKSTPLSVLQELGVTYDQLTNEILASQSASSPDTQALKAEIKALKESVDKTLTDRDAQSEEAVLNQMADNIDALVSEGDEFELIRQTKSQEDVLRRIHTTWKKTGRVLDEAEAARIIEGELLEEALGIAKLKKVHGKLTPPVEPQQQLVPQQAGMRTLTNKDSAKPLMDRKQRAMMAFAGTLKR